MHDHVLIVGGTGMLAEASVALGGLCRVLTSVARTERSLRALDRALARTGCQHHALALDWSAEDAFLEALSRHVTVVGHPSLVLAWVHADALGPRVARAVTSQSAPCDVFQVVGSATGNPGGDVASLLRDADLPRPVTYHRVVLGHHLDGTRWRWLTDAEISRGVLDAIERRAPVTVVGTLDRWDEIHGG